MGVAAFPPPGFLSCRRIDAITLEEARKHAAQVEKARQTFFATPAGRARAAFVRGDQVFQYAFDVMSQQAVVVPMSRASSTKRTADPSVILNTVCTKGWELLTGSFHPRADRHT